MNTIANVAAELWEEIFVLAVSEAHYGNCLDISNPRQDDETGNFYIGTLTSHGMDNDRRTLTAITQVSQQWRSISTQYTPLWQTILLTPSSTPTSISLWLDRSRDRDLIIVIDAAHKTMTTTHTLVDVTGREWHHLHKTAVDTTSMFLNITTLLCLHIHRWRSLTIIGDGFITVPSIIEALHQSEPAPRLESIQLCREHFSSPDLETQSGHLVTLFEQYTPSLRHVFVYGLSPPPSVTVLSHNLRSLCLGNTGSGTMAWADFTAIFALSVSLEYLSLWDIPCADTPGDDAVHSPINPQPSLSNLLSLSIGNVSVGFANNAVRCLKPYNLRRLTLSLDLSGPCDDVITFLTEPVNRHIIAHGITHLDLRGIVTSYATADRLCEELRNMRSCILRTSPTFTEALGNAVTPEDSSKCPSLETITFVTLLPDAPPKRQYGMFHRKKLNKFITVHTRG